MQRGSDQNPPKLTRNRTKFFPVRTFERVKAVRYGDAVKYILNWVLQESWVELRGTRDPY